MVRLNLQPKETDTQAWILASLGVEQFEVVQTKRGLVKRSKNLWLAKDGKALYWRANSGWFRSLTSEARIRGAPCGCSDIIGIVCGTPVFLEVKRLTPNGHTPARASQKEFEQHIKKAGGHYHIVSTPAQALEFDRHVRALAGKQVADGTQS